MVTRLVESLIDDLTLSASDPHCDREGLLSRIGAGLSEIEQVLYFGFAVTAGHPATDESLGLNIGTCARCGDEIRLGEPYVPAPPFHLSATDWFRHAADCPVLIKPAAHEPGSPGLTA